MRRSALRAILCFIAAFFGTSALAQETTLKVGVLGHGPDDPPITQDLSTAEVDALLNIFLPGQFGAHYTRDKANEQFAKIEGLRTQLNERLSSTLNAIPDVSIEAVSANTSALEASFTQTPGGVRVALGGLSIFVSFRYTKYDIPLLCESVEGHLTLSNISIGGEYDLATGTLQNPQIGYVLSNIRTRCDGLLGSVGDRIRSAFDYGTGYARELVLNELRSISDGQLQMANMRTIFSVSDFLEGLRNFSNYGVLNELANEAIDVGQQIVANPSSLYRALKLTVSVTYGPSGNSVSLIASHAEGTAVGEIQYGLRGLAIIVAPGPGTAQSTLFQRQRPGDPWYPFVTLPAGTDTFWIRGSLPIGTEIIAIGQNQWHSRLRSQAGASQIVIYDPTCTRLCEPILP